ncbi:hypothetical protein ACQ1Z2_16505, partial [Enterococcus faecalis]|uniref:hypothetical protein n=1 Tax=Enterococcus faecalis TaxID=1351 RepID=UPI003D6A3DA6
SENESDLLHSIAPKQSKGSRPARLPTRDSPNTARLPPVNAEIHSAASNAADLRQIVTPMHRQIVRFQGRYRRGVTGPI